MLSVRVMPVSSCAFVASRPVLIVLRYRENEGHACGTGKLVEFGKHRPSRRKGLADQIEVHEQC